MSQGGYSPQDVRGRTARAAAARGARPVAGDLVRWGAGVVTGLPHARGGGHGSFTFGGRSYPYRYHPYKFTWVTERAVEVPIVQAIVDEHRGARILEVGNVLGRYAPQDHLVVDKYEDRPGVVNRDVMDLADLGEFDLIVAISTLEHVGVDEEPRDPGKAVEALRRLQGMLAPGGRLVLTVPVGYHRGLDAAVRSGEFPVSSLGALRRGRIGVTRWSEVEPEEVWGASYDFLLYAARAVVVATIDRPAA